MEVTKFQVALTNNCHLRCDFCENSDEEQGNLYYIKPDVVIDNIKLLQAMEKCPIELGILVGEPLLYPADDFIQVLDYCYSESIEILIFTSLGVHNNNSCKIIDHLNDSVLLTFSIYGDTHETYSNRAGVTTFNQVIRSLEYIGSRKRDFQILFSNRTGLDSYEFSEELMESIRKNVTTIEHKHTTLDFVWDSVIADKEYTLMPDRKGPCTAALSDAGFNGKNEFILCTWLDMNGDTKLGTNQDSSETLSKAYNKELKKQQFNLFNKKCAMCDAYIPYEKDDGKRDDK